MYGRWNLARNNLKRFYQHRFYSGALLHASQPQIISKVLYSHEISCGFDNVSYQRFRSALDDELSQIANELHEEVADGVEKMCPELATAAKYYFHKRARGKLFRPNLTLLMASALNVPNGESLRKRQHCIAKATEMIHVASLLHDDVLDKADKRRGIESLNSVMGNEFAVSTGRFLMGEASCAIAQLNNIEVNCLFAQVTSDIVDGERMQMNCTLDRLSMDYYLKKTEKKTASLLSTSCKAISVIAGNPDEVSMLAYKYGQNLGLAYQLTDDVLDFTGKEDVLGKGTLSDIKHGIITAPILFAMKEFPKLRKIVDNPADVDLSLDYLGKSGGIKRTKQLALEYANRAKKTIEDFPYCNHEHVLMSRKALTELPFKAIRRSK